MTQEYARVQRFLEGMGLEVSPETVERYGQVLSKIAVPQESMENIIDGIFDEEDCDGMIIEKDIPTFSWCEHHILPWFGFTHIGYICQGKVLGLSKFTRLVNLFCSGLTIQERMGKQIADFLAMFVSPDVMVVVSAIHTCKVARGVENPFSRTYTVEARGLFRENEGPRLEFFSILSREDK